MRTTRQTRPVTEFDPDGPFPPHVGGSFAPPLDAGKVAAYRALADGATPDVRAEVSKLCDMVEAYLGLGVPAADRHGPGEAHPSGFGLVVRLPGDAVEALDPLVPWPREVRALGALFDTIDPVAAKPLRDAAHHLLWYAAELTLDRRPITSDTL